MSLMYYNSLFFLFLMMNLFMNFCNVTCPTSVLFFTLWMSFSVWTSLKFKGFINNPSKMSSEMVPHLSAIQLIPLNVLSHFMSSLASSLVLALRITVNLSVGELLLNLISWMSFENNLPVMSFLLMFLELLVSVVQAYIFVKLSNLYFKDIK